MIKRIINFIKFLRSLSNHSMDVQKIHDRFMYEKRTESLFDTYKR